jgi:hypothetical protein
LNIKNKKKIRKTEQKKYLQVAIEWSGGTYECETKHLEGWVVASCWTTLPPRSTMHRVFTRFDIVGVLQADKFRTDTWFKVIECVNKT